MSSTSEPKAFIGAKSKLVWSVWLFSGFGILLHYFPLELRLPSFSSSPASVSAPPVRQRTAEESVSRNSSYPRNNDQASILVEIRPDEWSDWVRLPEGEDFRFVYPNLSFDLLFPNGTTRSYTDDELPKVRDPLPGRVFRVRGARGALEIVFETSQVRLELDPSDWSCWVKIPPGYRWRINRPGCWEQYWFRGEAEPRPRLEAGSRVRYGEIPNTTFKVRGTKGPVEIVIEPQ